MVEQQKDNSEVLLNLSVPFSEHPPEMPWINVGMGSQVLNQEWLKKSNYVINAKQQTTS